MVNRSPQPCPNRSIKITANKWHEMAGRSDAHHFEDRLIRRLELISTAQVPPSHHRIVEETERIPFVQLGAPATPDAQDLPDVEPFHSDLNQTARHKIECKSGDIWIQGNALLCSCPDCNAPMTIRIWLQLADCWRCQTCISLTEEQIEAVKQLVQTRQSESKTAVLSHHPPVQTQDSIGLPVESPIQVSAAGDSRQRELEKLTRTSLAASVIRRGFSLTPAWMVSFLLHLIAILLLALIVFRDSNYLPETITLSTFLDSQREPGGQIRLENPLDALQDDLELASQMEMGDREIRDVLKKANQDAKELVVDPQPLAPLPDIQQIKKNITTRPDRRMSFAARDPRVRSEIVRREGGTTVTEAAVARGLRWLASVQNKDGSWSLKYYRKHNRPANEGDIMGTSLALLPMLGAGQTQEYGIYKRNVAAGLAWMIENQKPDGDLRAGYDGQAGMYAHGQATIVLCEALALTGDQQLRKPAQLAIQFIERAQHGQGGWRYQPGQAGDTSVFGWQMMALQSGRAPQLNLEVDEATLKLADYFLDRVTVPARFKNRARTPLPEGSAYCYQRGKPPTAAMTAEAILCRMYLGWKKRDPRLSSAVKWLIADHLPSNRDRNLYYWYYGTQVMHHYGGEPWKIWNDRMRELLISSQETRGAHPGSWSPGDFEWGPRGGRIYTTSLAVCTLEVYYRHLPIFKQIELND